MRFRYISLVRLVLALLACWPAMACAQTPDARWVKLEEKLMDRLLVNPDSCTRVAQAWYAETKESGSQAWQSKALNVLGQSAYYAGKYPAAQQYMNQCLELQAEINDQKVVGEAYYYLAMAIYEEGKYSESIFPFRKAISALNLADLTWTEANANFLLGYAYYATKNFELARQHYKAASELFKKYVSAKVTGDTYSFWAEMENFEVKDYATAAGLYANAARVYDDVNLEKNAAYNYFKVAEMNDFFLDDKAEAIKAYEKAYAYYKKTGDNPERLSRITKSLGDLCYATGKYEPAIGYLNLAADLFHKQGSLVDEGNCYIVLGNIYYFSGNYPDALTYSQKSLQCFEKANSVGGMAGSYVGLGNIYKSRNDNTKAMEMFRKSLELYQSQEDKNYIGMSGAYTGLGNCHYTNGDADEALKCYLASLECDEKSNSKETDKSVAYMNIASIYINREDNANSEKYLDLAITESKRTNNQHRLGAALKSRGYYHNNKKEHKQAFDDCSEALEITSRLGLLPDVKECYSCMYYAAYDMGNYHDALIYYSKYIGARDSVDNEKRNTELNKREMQFAYDKKEAQLKLEEERQRFALQEELKRKQLFYDFQVQKAAIKAKAEQEELAMKEELKRKKLSLDYERNQEKVKLNNERREMQYKRSIAEQEIHNAEQRRLNKWLFAGLSIFVLLTLVILKGYRDKQKANKVILAQKEQTEQQKQVIEFKSQQLEEKNREIVDSITYARRLQEAILPPQKLVRQYLHDSFILYKPRDIVAGDFYWMEPVPAPQGGEMILFAVADCTGHGVPGAMVSVVCSGALNRAVKEFGLTDPGKILDKVRELVIETFEKSESEVKDGMDISLGSLKFNVESLKLDHENAYNQPANIKPATSNIELHWAGANNPVWIIRKGSDGQATDVVIEIKADKQPIGMSEHVKPFTTHSIALQKGDIIYLSSDGYADQFGGDKGKKFKEANMKKLLLDIYTEPMHKQAQLIDQAFETWRGQLEQVDDVCVIGVRV